MQLTQEQAQDIQSRIDSASKEINPILSKYQLAIAGKPIKVEIAKGVFGDTVQIGYIDTKFTQENPVDNVKKSKKVKLPKE